MDCSVALFISADVKDDDRQSMTLMHVGQASRKSGWQMVRRAIAPFPTACTWHLLMSLVNKEREAYSGIRMHAPE